MSRAHFSKGFSLIELVITLTLMAVLSTLAFSKLKGNYDRASARSASASMDQSFRYARSEARTRTNNNVGVIRICALNDAKTACQKGASTTHSAANIWTNGWYTYVENDGIAGIGNTDQLLKQETTAGQITITSGKINNSGVFIEAAFENAILEFGTFGTAARNSTGSTIFDIPAFQFSYDTDDITRTIAQINFSKTGQTALLNLSDIPEPD